jgi:hypothetical protein
MRTRTLAPTLLTVLLLFSSAAVHPQSIFKGCKAEGQARKTKKNPTGKISEGTKAQNRLKNRDDAPADIDESVTLAELLKKANNNAFKPTQGVEITGYVVDVTPGGRQESCNCGRKDLQDIHINVVARRSHAPDERQHFIVEITPRWQEKLGKDFSDVRKELKDRCVKFTGFLFYDSIHAGESQNTRQKGKKVWRRTAWEVHPVTAYRIVGHEDCPI